MKYYVTNVLLLITSNFFNSTLYNIFYSNAFKYGWILEGMKIISECDVRLFSHIFMEFQAIEEKSPVGFFYILSLLVPILSCCTLHSFNFLSFVFNATWKVKVVVHSSNQRNRGSIIASLLFWILEITTIWIAPLQTSKTTSERQKSGNIEHQREIQSNQKSDRPDSTRSLKNQTFLAMRLLQN